jgi:putative transcriptional regulator
MVTMKWNLRLAAAQRDIWKASQLQAMLAEAGLGISAGKMSNLWSSQPVTIRLEDLQVICSVLGCTPNDLLVMDQDLTLDQRVTEQAPMKATAGQAPIQHRLTGRARPPL